MSTKNMLEEANEIVNKRSQEKERQYGPFNNTMKNMTEIYNSITGSKASVEDMYMSMVAMKLARQRFAHKRDNLLDAVAYLGALDNYINSKKANTEKSEPRTIVVETNDEIIGKKLKITSPLNAVQPTPCPDIELEPDKVYMDTAFKVGAEIPDRLFINKANNEPFLKYTQEAKEAKEMEQILDDMLDDLYATQDKNMCKAMQLEDMDSAMLLSENDLKFVTVDDIPMDEFAKLAHIIMDPPEHLAYPQSLATKSYYALKSYKMHRRLYPQSFSKTPIKSRKRKKKKYKRVYRKKNKNKRNKRNKRR